MAEGVRLSVMERGLSIAFRLLPKNDPLPMTNSVQTFTGGFTATNGYTFQTPHGLLAIDAPEGMAAWLAQTGQKVAALFLTHWHFDHVMDAAAIARRQDCEIFAWGPSDPASRLEDLLTLVTGQRLGVAEYPVHQPLAGKDRVTMAGAGFLLRHVPGHSPDSLVLISETDRLLFAGDTVMDGGIGRTDFPGGDFDLLVTGIRDKILTLPGDYLIYPGHGSPTTVAAERRDNAWLQ